jgi:hypothetical protein
MRNKLTIAAGLVTVALPIVGLRTKCPPRVPSALLACWPRWSVWREI